MARVLQINLNHCAVAQNLLLQLVREEKADIAIVSEEYRDLNEPNWVKDTTSKAAIWICGNLHISCKIFGYAEISIYPARWTRHWPGSPG